MASMALVSDPGDRGQFHRQNGHRHGKTKSLDKEGKRVADSPEGGHPQTVPRI